MDIIYVCDVNHEVLAGTAGSPYDYVGEYIWRYWKHHGYSDVVFEVELSYDGIEWHRYVEFASPDDDLHIVEYENDWCEGEQFVYLKGISSLEALSISGGLYGIEENK